MNNRDDRVIGNLAAPSEHERRRVPVFAGGFEPELVEDLARGRILRGATIIDIEVLVQGMHEAVQEEAQHSVLDPLTLDAAAEHQIQKARFAGVDEGKADDPVMAESVTAV